MRALFTFLFLVVLGIYACGPSYLYEKKVNINDAQWSYQDTLAFEFDIPDTLAAYDLMLAIDHGTGYAYQNIYIKIFTRFPDGTHLEQQVPIDFADSKGIWYGKCGTSNCDLGVMLQEHAHFNQIGTYSLRIAQFMRIDPLPEIHSVALQLNKKGEI